MAGAPIEYSETVLEHFRTPRNTGAFPPDTPDVLEGQAGNRQQGLDLHQKQWDEYDIEPYGGQHEGPKGDARLA